MSAQDEVVSQPENHDSPKDHTRPVHRDKRDRHGGWEEGKQRRDDKEAGCNDVEGQAELAESPRAHTDIFALDTLADHEEDGDEVGEEEASNCQRHNGVEGCGGGDVDQANDGGGSGAKEDGAERERRFANLERNEC
jgi:hypothetical protein